MPWLWEKNYSTNHHRPTNFARPRRLDTRPEKVNLPVLWHHTPQIPHDHGRKNRARHFRDSRGGYFALLHASMVMDCSPILQELRQSPVKIGGQTTILRTRVHGAARSSRV